jgi:anti-anti-sigma factor
MEITAKKENQALILSVKGRLDAVTSPEFEITAFASVDKGDVTILLDMGAVDYISSAGLRSVLALMKKLKPLNGRLILFAMQDQVKEVFAISGFSSIIEIVDNQQTALGLI